ncbi:hypothetical protein QYF36_002117 [Acer negundo]|nr:hypothetical protein QYF36_002117 [Acer negundo]
MTASTAGLSVKEAARSGERVAEKPWKTVSYVWSIWRGLETNSEVYQWNDWIVSKEPERKRKRRNCMEVEPERNEAIRGSGSEVK